MKQPQQPNKSSSQLTLGSSLQKRKTLVSTLVPALLAQTALPLAAVASESGFSSVRELRAHCRHAHDLTPTELRRMQRVARVESSAITLTLPVKGPYNIDWAFDYLKRRTLLGIEEVSGHHYKRRVSTTNQPPVWVEVWASNGNLQARLPLGGAPVYKLLSRVARLFDLHTDSRVIDHALSTCSPLLAQSVDQAPGLRVLGAWDGFETTVRAVLGQQVSVARGTELANRMIQAYGKGDFPHPSQLKDRDIAELGMPGNRGRAIATIAGWVVQENLDLPEGEVAEAFVARIGEIKGIGPWTQNYIRLRVVKDQDAFPHNDWVVLKHLQTTPAKALKTAEQWRPWRAYGLMHLWRLASIARGN
jgi:AraC family transcriptional regulator of adaptative response / DNA-3-methyladenine glycosylase II